MNIEISVKSTGFWGAEGNGELVLKNCGQNDLSDWTFDIITNGFIIKQLWNLELGGDGCLATISPAKWGTCLKVNEEHKCGFSYSGSSDSLIIGSKTPGIKILSRGMPNIADAGQIRESMSSQKIPSLPNKSCTAITNLTNKKTFGYFSEWSIYDRKFGVEQIPAHNLTHIIYAFMLPNPSEEDFNKLKEHNPFPPKPYRPPPEIPEGHLVFHDECAGHENIKKLQNLKQHNSHIKVLPSVGGWTLSWTMSKIAACSSLRKTFVQSAVDFIIEKDFDGLDYDWEYVGKQGAGYNYVDSKNDGKNFIELLKETRIYMDLKSPNKHLEITSAIGTSPDVIKNYLGTEPFFDFVLLMTYDYAGHWDNVGGHLSGLYHNPAAGYNNGWNCHAAVENFRKIGFSNEKICLGCPMYGRGWQKIQPPSSVPTRNSQVLFGNSIAGPGPSHSGAAGEPGLSSWRHLKITLENISNYKRYFDDIAKGVYCRNDMTGECWSYEDPESAAEKAKYVLEQNLAGMLFWELSDDTRDGKDNILDRVVSTFSHNENTNNSSSNSNINTPTTNYTNYTNNNDTNNTNNTNTNTNTNTNSNSNSNNNNNSNNDKNNSDHHHHKEHNVKPHQYGLTTVFENTADSPFIIESRSTVIIDEKCGLELKNNSENDFVIPKFGKLVFKIT